MPDQSSELGCWTYIKLRVSLWCLSQILLLSSMFGSSSSQGRSKSCSPSEGRDEGHLGRIDSGLRRGECGCQGGLDARQGEWCEPAVERCSDRSCSSESSLAPQSIFHVTIRRSQPASQEQAGNDRPLRGFVWVACTPKLRNCVGRSLHFISRFLCSLTLTAHPALHLHPHLHLHHHGQSPRFATNSALYIATTSQQSFLLSHRLLFDFRLLLVVDLNLPSPGSAASPWYYLDDMRSMSHR